MRWSTPILAASLCAACVNPVELNSAIQPSQSVSDRSSEKAGVVCSPNLLEHIERANPSTLVGLATTYEFELGEPLCNALQKSVEGTYREAVRATTPYYKGQYARVIQFDLQNSALSIVPRARGQMRVAYTLSVVVERYGLDLKLLGRNAVTGNGLVDCSKLTDEVVRQAVESALQQVADEASDLLVARLDGPRVPAPPER
jgi:hypothetical protein